MFQSTEAATRTEFGNAEVDDMTLEHPPKVDSMQSFWTAEILKYFYLLFSSEDMISLDDYVL
jgi:mannosyl-oligosaccharide alpha-1,2-mannosidase